MDWDVWGELKSFVAPNKTHAKQMFTSQLHEQQRINQVIINRVSDPGVFWSECSLTADSLYVPL